MNHFVAVAGATLFTDAAALVARHGEAAAEEAERLAAASRNDGNLVRFCRWRDVRRLLTVLAARETTGALH